MEDVVACGLEGRFRREFGQELGIRDGVGTFPGDVGALVAGHRFVASDAVGEGGSRFVVVRFELCQQAPRLVGRVFGSEQDAAGQASESHRASAAIEQGRVAQFGEVAHEQASSALLLDEALERGQQGGDRQCAATEDGHDGIDDKEFGVDALHLGGQKREICGETEGAVIEQACCEVNSGQTGDGSDFGEIGPDFEQARSDGIFEVVFQTDQDDTALETGRAIGHAGAHGHTSGQIEGDG